MNYLENIILITGCARSGTSLTAGIINLCGAFGGKMRPPNHNNKKGMFENTVITQCIVKPFLKSIGADQMGQNPLPDSIKVRRRIVSEGSLWANSVLDVFRKEGYKEDRQLFYKGAKMCLIWEMWNAAFPDAQWIIVRRNKKDIIDSCLRTSFMRAYKDEEGWGKWVDWHEKKFKEMFENKLNVIEISSEKIVLGDFSEIKTIAIEMGLSYNEQEVKKFVSPELFHLSDSK